MADLSLAQVIARIEQSLDDFLVTVSPDFGSFSVEEYAERKQRFRADLDACLILLRQQQPEREEWWRRQWEGMKERAEQAEELLRQQQGWQPGEVEARFSDLISTELENYAQKVAKRALRKALSGKIAERSDADNT
jgi:hypothetical protein